MTKINSYNKPNITRGQRSRTQSPALRRSSTALRAFLIFWEVKMYGIKSSQGRWSVSLCDCSEDTAHFHYGNVVLHISRDDLRELGLAMQSVADGAEQIDARHDDAAKKELVQ